MINILFDVVVFYRCVFSFGACRMEEKGRKKREWEGNERSEYVDPVKTL